MSEIRKFYVNCEALGALVENSHPNTRIGDLTEEELYQIFVPPLLSTPDFEAPGAVLLAVEGSMPVFKYGDPNYQKINIRTFHQKHCLPKKPEFPITQPPLSSRP